MQACLPNVYIYTSRPYKWNPPLFKIPPLLYYYGPLSALSCDPTLEAPENGTIACDRQTVGGMCSFTCDEGFTLRGGERRTCLPSLMWRERPAICDPPTCPELEPPLNGFIVFPCTREEGDSCMAVCAHGYRAVGPTLRTCVRDSGTDSLIWSDGPQCVGESYKSL